MLTLLISGCITEKQDTENTQSSESPWTTINTEYAKEGTKTDKMEIPEGTIYRTIAVWGTGGGIAMVFVPSRRDNT